MGIFGKKDKTIKKSNESNIKNASSNLINIVIYKKYSSDTYFQIADFKAKETKELDGSIKAVNDERMFEENLDFQEDDVFKLLAIELELNDKSVDKKIEIIKLKVQKQRELLKKLKTDVEENNFYNYVDEKQMLRLLKTLYDSVKNKRKGTYVRIGKDGIRTYEFESVDGVLKPFFFGSSNNYVDVDKTLKVKHYLRQDRIHAEQMKQFNMPKFSTNIITMLAIVLCIMILGNMVWGYYNFKRAGDIELETSNGAITCSNNVAKISSLLNSACVVECMTEKKQSNINDKKDNNIKTDINLNPLDITKK